MKFVATLANIVNTITTMMRDQKIEDGGRAKQKNEQQEKQDDNARKVNAAKSDDDERERVRSKYQRKSKSDE